VGYLRLGRAKVLDEVLVVVPEISNYGSCVCAHPFEDRAGFGEATELELRVKEFPLLWCP